MAGTAFAAALGSVVTRETILLDTKANNATATESELSAQERRKELNYEDIEAQRMVIFEHMQNMDKASLDFSLVPKVTNVVNEQLQDAIEAALSIGTVPVRILCAPPGYGKTYAMCVLMKKLLKAQGKIAGADIICGNQRFQEGHVDLDEWLLQHFGVGKKMESISLEEYFAKPQGVAENDRPYYIIFDELDKVRLHQYFEEFILRLKDIGLRHKNVRFLFVTHEPHAAELIRRMNGNEKIRFVYEQVNAPKWTRDMLRTHFHEQTNYYKCNDMKKASNVEQFLDMAERAGTPEFVLDVVSSHTQKHLRQETVPFSFDMDYCRKAADNAERAWTEISQMKTMMQERPSD
ncbi:uncharacterized protein MONBRDRAFT_29981 [Monosiga brevicollis MX1]|uniref:Uncharacterized protein n=1 Tax=Monosiga brevicollis TaxID=81824 RepID=A9VCN8_MONBE|nr:uncharacterized protein MONBRDRAFT_29981 [Monosiga brevicollis MX1]EDQ84718.1 predicted protein [Monosiga brevicollis MX1]|eukprot:XP_001750504.1 hypothetical protein [Monosiga brevicollis MX1]